MKASLKAFVKTGVFGQIQLRMKRSSVASFLGAPTDWLHSAPSREQSAIWKYGDVEFHFENDVLHMIFLDKLRDVKGSRNLELDLWTLSEGLSLSEAEEHLAKARVTFRTEKFFYNEGGVLLIARAGTTLSFCNREPRVEKAEGEEEEEPLLRAVYRRA